MALATALTIQIALLDWIRLGAVRFYSERVRAAEPTISATLDTAFALISFGIVAIAVIVAFLDTGLDPTRGLMGLALGVSIANGLFDYRTALVRARFHDRLVIVKNVVSLVLTGGAAFLFESAPMALIGGILSLAGSILTAWAAMADQGAETSQARLAEQLIVPSQYRGPFARFIALLLPGLCATGMIHFAVNPIFQIGKKTAPVIGAALIGGVMNGVLVLLLAGGADASGFAIAQSGAAIASLAALLAFAARTRPHWPALRDLAAIAISTGAMVLVLLPLPKAAPGMLTLAAEIVVGIAVFATLMLAFDAIGLRQLLIARVFAKPAEVR